MPVGGEERGGDSRLSPPSNESNISNRNLQSTRTEPRDTTLTMEDHRNKLKLKIGSVPAPGDRGGERTEEKQIDLGIFGETWKLLNENVQSASTPYIEITTSWSAERKKRKFIKKMDITYHSICRLRDIKEENQQNIVYNKVESTDSQRQVHLPPHAKIPSAGEILKRDKLGAVPKIMERKEKEKESKLGRNVENKKIVRKKIEEKEKGGDKENQSPKIYKMGKIGEFLKRKSILKEKPVQEDLIFANCGPEKRKSTNGEQSTKKSTTGELPTKKRNPTVNDQPTRPEKSTKSIESDRFVEIPKRSTKTEVGEMLCLRKENNFGEKLNVETFERFVVTENFGCGLSLCLTDLGASETKLRCHVVEQKCEFVKIRSEHEAGITAHGAVEKSAHGAGARSAHEAGAQSAQSTQSAQSAQPAQSARSARSARSAQSGPQAISTVWITGRQHRQEHRHEAQSGAQATSAVRSTDRQHSQEHRQAAQSGAQAGNTAQAGSSAKAVTKSAQPAQSAQSAQPAQSAQSTQSAQPAQSAAGMAGAHEAGLAGTHARSASLAGIRSASMKIVDKRRADDVSVDDGNAIRQCVGLGSGKCMGFGASMHEIGCVVNKHVSNNILCSSTAARTSPGRMGSRMRSSGSSTTSPWRGVGASSRSIGRTAATTRGSKGSSKPQSNVVASKVGKLIAVHHGLILEQTNRGVETDQWPSPRHSREQGSNGSQAAGPGSQ